MTSAQTLPEITETTVPRLTPGLELYGAYQGSGFATPQYVARRGDGQVLQLTELLQLTAQEIDGRRTVAELAERVTQTHGRRVSADNVGLLISKWLLPLGVVAVGDTVVTAARIDLIGGLKGHQKLFSPTTVNRIAGGLTWLHHPVAVAAVLLTAVLFDVWLFAVHGALQPILAILAEPLNLLGVLGLLLVGVVFHEFGHASACRYGGARPGVIGYGLFLIWPAFYTDVTDVYRLGRAGRLRTDLGGIYFNIVYLLLMAGLYGLTGDPLFLAVAFLSHFEVLKQLLPIMRLDGYYILGDLVGVPDLFGRVRPTLAGLLPGRAVDRRVADLRPATRRMVAAWVLVVVPLIAVNVAYLLWNLPRIVERGLSSVQRNAEATVVAWQAQEFATAVLGGIAVLLLCIPTIGVVYLLVRILGRGLHLLTRATRDRPVLRRSAYAAASCAAALTVAIGWIAP